MRQRIFPLVILLTAIAIACAGCTPLTFSNEAAVDFNQYTSVYIAPLEGADWSFPMFGDEDLDDYLVEEMTDHSGFSLFTTNPDQESSLYLYVTIQVKEEEKTTSTDDGTETEYEFEAIATYEAFTGGNKLIDKGSEKDTSSDRDAAIRDALDEIVIHYLPTYRI